jgi:hypothetical protein
MEEAMSNQDDTNQPLVVVVPVTVTVDPKAYELNYGQSDDIVGYTSETVRAAAAEQLNRLGWGTVTTEDDPTT